jgi:hypothetical protein
MPYAKPTESKPFKCTGCGVKTANLGKKCTRCLDPLRAIRFSKVKVEQSDRAEMHDTVYIDKRCSNEAPRRVVRVARLPGSDIMEN